MALCKRIPSRKIKLYKKVSLKFNSLILINLIKMKKINNCSNTYLRKFVYSANKEYNMNISVITQKVDTRTAIALGKLMNPNGKYEYWILLRCLEYLKITQRNSHYNITFHNILLYRKIFQKNDVLFAIFDKMLNYLNGLNNSFLIYNKTSIWNEPICSLRIKKPTLKLTTVYDHINLYFEKNQFLHLT